MKWCVALEFMNYWDGSRVKRILPIFVGSIDSSNKKCCDIFNDKRFHNVPNVIPTATLERAEELMRKCGMETIRDDFSAMTIKSIIQRMSDNMGLNAWEFKKMPADATVKILACLRNAASSNSR